MDWDKRSNEKQTRQFMMALLDDAQKEVVTQCKIFGWYLNFVRQPLGQPVIPVLKNSDTGRYAILEPDGSLNRIGPGFLCRVLGFEE